MKKRDLYKFIDSVKSVRNGADDELALESKYIYPNWRVDTKYSVNDRIQYADKLYRCIQAHTSQESWSPDITPALWTEIFIEEFPEWKQPLGSEDSYHLGDKVSHAEKHWISEVEANIWEPGVYGWREI